MRNAATACGHDRASAKHGSRPCAALQPHGPHVMLAPNHMNCLPVAELSPIAQRDLPAMTPATTARQCNIFIPYASPHLRYNDEDRMGTPASPLVRLCRRLLAPHPVPFPPWLVQVSVVLPFCRPLSRGGGGWRTSRLWTLPPGTMLCLFLPREYRL